MNKKPITNQLYRASPVQRAASIVAASILVIVGVCELMGWSFLAKPVERLLSETMQREVVLTSQDNTQSGFKLHVIGGIRLTVNRLEVAAPAWSKSPYMLAGENVRLRLRYMDLLNWQRDAATPLRIASLQADRLDGHIERLADGRASWQFSSEKSDTPTPPTPVFGLLAIKAGTIKYDDMPLDLALNVQLSLQEGDSESDVLRVSAQGDYQRKPLEIKLASVGVLPWVAQEASPIPVDLNIELGTAKLNFKGKAADALQLQQLAGNFQVSGPSLASVGDALGITLPNTPPFRINGKLTRDASTWQASIASAKIGSSQLNGEFLFDGAQETPLLSGTLKGKSLVLADLGPTVGAPAVKTEPTQNSTGKVIPSKPFDLPSLRAMNADVNIDIDNLDLGSEILKPLRPLRAHLVLTDGVLKISEIDARTAQGELAGMVQLDGRKDLALWEMDLKWQGVQLEQWLNIARDANKPPYVTGRMNGAAKLTGQGRSTAEILGSLAGNVRNQVREGTISHLVIEAAGLDAAETLGVWFRGDDVLQMNCAYADLEANDGLLKPRVFVVDTPDSAMWVNGTISMKTEALDLRVVVTPKDFSPVSLRTPLLISGTMGSPNVSLEKGPLVGKVAGAVLLSLVNPFAALIPFLDTGTADDVKDTGKTGCYDLAARSKVQREKNE